MRDPLARVSIRFKLTAAFVGICLSAFGVGGYMVSTFARDSLEKEVLQRLRSESARIALHLDNRLDMFIRRAEDFASDGYIRTKLESASLRMRGSGSNEKLAEDLRSHLVRNKFPLIQGLANLSIHAADGRCIASVVERDFLAERGLKALRWGEDKVCGTLLLDHGDSTRWVFPICTPIRHISRNENLGTLVFWVDAAEWIRNSSALLALPETSEHFTRIGVTDGRGSVLQFEPILTAAGIPGLKLKPAGAEAPAEKLRSHVGTHRCSDGREKLGYRHSIPHGGWIVMMEQDAARALQPVSGLQSRFLGAALLFVLAAIVVMFFPIRFLVRPLSVLRDAARRIAGGDYSTRVNAEEGDEIGDLGVSFNLMAQATEERTRRLKDTAHQLDQKRLELQSERDLLKSVVSAMKDGVVFIDAAGAVVLHNTAGAPLARALSDGSTTLESRWCEGEGKGAHCAECLRHKGCASTQCTIELDERVFEMLTADVHSDHGPYGKIIVARDVTERHQIDAREAHKERLAMLGEIAAVMAHELNNPLAAISMYSQMIEKSEQNQPRYQEHLAVIRRNADTCKRTIRGLLDYAHGATLELTEFSINEHIVDLVHFLRPMYESSNITFNLNLAASYPILVADETYVRQILMNILINAVHAVGNHGTVGVYTDCDGDDDRIGILITDDGPGIPEEWTNRIFDPFFSTKPTGKGTGLGLSTARGIAESMGGGIHLESSVPGDTRFRIILPRHPGPGEWHAETEHETEETGVSK
ncbi:MAG: ATP-binding protein [Bacteroidota bacterium]